MTRPKLDRIQISPYKVAKSTPKRLENLAIGMGYRHGSRAAMGKFLDMVANLDPDLLAIIARKSDLISQTNQNTTIINDIML